MFHRKKAKTHEEEVRELTEGIRAELKKIEEVQKILEKEGHTTKTEFLLSGVSFRLSTLSREVADLRSEFRFLVGVLAALLLFIAGLHLR